MTNIEEVLDARKASLVSDIAELSKTRFFSIRALGYCLGFVKESIQKLDPSQVNDSYPPISDHFPAEWLAVKSYDLISEKFDGYDAIEEMPKVTRLNNYLRSQMFITLMAELEDYLNHVLELVLLAYPQKLNSEHFDINETLKEPNADDLIREKVAKKIMDKQYGKPKQYFNFVVKVLDCDQTIDRILSEEQVSDPTLKAKRHQVNSLNSLFPDYLEMKARRDVGIHNGWLRNSLYDERVRDFDDKTYPNTGNFLCVDQAYFRQSMEVAISLVSKCNMFCKLGFTEGDV